MADKFETLASQVGNPNLFSGFRKANITKGVNKWHFLIESFWNKDNKKSLFPNKNLMLSYV